MSARRPCGIAHRAARLRAVVAACVFAAVGLAQAPSADPAIDLAQALTRDDSPLVRAEAALLLARLAPARAEAAARSAAADRDPQVRALGLIALGLVAAPGAEVVLGDAFEEGRHDVVHSAAAFGLGVLPDSQPAPALDRYLARVDGASYRRHRDALAAIVHGMTRVPHPSRRASLQRLLDDAANRDGGLRALAILALGRAGDRPAPDEIARRLESEYPLARLAALDDLADAGEPGAPELERITALARTDRDPRVRRRAVDLLVGARSAAALQVAGDALGREDADDLAAGVVATTTLGGGLLRDDLVERIATEGDPARQAAMFGAWRGPVPTELADAALAFAADRRRSADQRALATHLLARTGDERAVPLLRALVVEGDDGPLVAQVVEDLARLGADGDLAERLAGGGRGRALRQLAPRIEALFRLGRPEALGLLRDALDDERLGSAARAELLRAWRRAVMPPPTGDIAAALPDDLLGLLR